MKNAEELIISGIQSPNVLGGLSLLQSCVSIGELLTILPQEHLLLDLFSANYERSVNKERLDKLASYYLKSVTNNTPFDIPNISLVAYNQAREESLYERVVSLQYDRKESAIVDGFLAISALSKLLDRIDPFTGKKVNKSVLTSKQKQALMDIDVRLSVYYCRNEKINEEIISKLFLHINTLDTRVYSQSISTQVQESPLNLGAEKLAHALNLDLFGGISDLNKITKSDSYVTTKTTLIQILLASLGGRARGLRNNYLLIYLTRP